MNILVTGISTSGKSSLAAEFNGRGVRAYDADFVPGLGRWEDGNGEAVESPDSLNRELLKKMFYNWNRQKLLSMISDAGDTVVCGISTNVLDFFDDFDKQFLLGIDAHTLEQRLEARHWGFGHTPPEREIVRKYHREFESSAIQKGAVAINASLPTAEIADKMLGTIRPQKALFNLKLPEISIIPDVILGPETAFGEASL